MNSIHNNGENDQPLNEGLDKLSHVYGQMEQDEPPELLDQAILNSAHRAVEKTSHWMQFGWLHGLTTAAVFVLAFSIILNQREHAPDSETRMRNDKPVGLQQQEVAKKRSAKQLERRPAAAPPASAALQNASEYRVEQAVPEARSSMYVLDGLQGKDERSDEDIPIEELQLEEELMDAADMLADGPEADVSARLASPAVVGKTAASEMKARVRAEPEVEQILQAIIKLKQSGNQSWKTELELFRESYPDYPLPDELKD